MSMGGSRGGGGAGGPDPPLENHKNIEYRVFSNTGPDPLENNNATKPAFYGEMAFKWRFASGPIMTPLLVIFEIWIISPPYKLKKKRFQS